MERRWWQKKKVWGTLLSAALMMFGSRWGVDPDVASRAALVILGGVSVEGIVDAASAFATAWKDRP